MNLKHIGMLYDMDPGVDNLTRKFRRTIKTIIYFCRKEKKKVNLHKYIIKEDMRLKFLDYQ